MRSCFTFSLTWIWSGRQFCLVCPFLIFLRLDEKIKYFLREILLLVYHLINIGNMSHALIFERFGFIDIHFDKLIIFQTQLTELSDLLFRKLGLDVFLYLINISHCLHILNCSSLKFIIDLCQLILGQEDTNLLQLSCSLFIRHFDFEFIFISFFIQWIRHHPELDQKLHGPIFIISSFILVPIYQVLENFLHYILSFDVGVLQGHPLNNFDHISCLINGVFLLVLKLYVFASS